MSLAVGDTDLNRGNGRRSCRFGNLFRGLWADSGTFIAGTFVAF